MESFDSAEVLIVIPCLNEERNITDVLETLLADQAVARRSIIVVADGGSSDRTREIVTELSSRSPSIRLIDNPRRLQSAGVNLAVSLLGRNVKWLVRIDAHAHYPERYVSTLIAEAERTGAASVVVAMDSQGRTCFQKAAAVAQNSFLGAGGSAHRMRGNESFVDHGHHALFLMSAFKAIGGYDERQSHNEDAEFDVRLVRSGGRIWLTRATNLVYYPRDRLPALYAQYQNYGRGRAITILRHRIRPKLRQLLPAGVAPALACLALTPWLPIAALPAIIWLAACLIYGCLLGARKNERCAFASGFAAMAMHLGWSVGFWLTLFQAPLIDTIPGRMQTR